LIQPSRPRLCLSWRMRHSTRRRSLSLSLPRRWCVPRTAVLRRYGRGLPSRWRRCSGRRSSRADRQHPPHRRTRRRRQLRCARPGPMSRRPRRPPTRRPTSCRRSTRRAGLRLRSRRSHRPPLCDRRIRRPEAVSQRQPRRRSCNHRAMRPRVAHVSRRRPFSVQPDRPRRPHRSSLRWRHLRRRFASRRGRPPRKLPSLPARSPSAPWRPPRLGCPPPGHASPLANLELRCRCSLESLQRSCSWLVWPSSRSLERQLRVRSRTAHRA
jgi:hypothetical protein